MRLMVCGDQPAGGATGGLAASTQFLRSDWYSKISPPPTARVSSTPASTRRVSRRTTSLTVVSSSGDDSARLALGPNFAGDAARFDDRCRCRQAPPRDVAGEASRHDSVTLDADPDEEGPMGA